ncbi:MAG: sensor histidine kinase [Paenibacillaceae bacterium]|nr:sensor histidine kinase [Paenibacillaceae bacterium]
MNNRWIYSKKMIVVYVGLVMIPVVCLLSYFYQKSRGILEDEVTQSMLAAINQVEINVSYRLSKVNEISDILVMNADLHRYLSVRLPERDAYQQLGEQKALSNMIDNLQTSPDIQKVRMYVDPGKMYAGEHVNFFSLDEAVHMPWYKAVLEQNGGMYWISTYTYHYLGAKDPVSIMSGARIVKDPDDYNKIEGILLIDFPVKNIGSILQNVHFNSKDSTIYIVDEHGKVIVHSDETMLGRQTLYDRVFRDIASRDQGIVAYNGDQGRQFAIYKTIPSTGWKIVTTVSAATINHTNATYSSMTSIIIVLVALLVLFLVAFVIFGFVTENMVKRITQMTQLIKREGVHTLDDAASEQKGTVVRLEKSVRVMLTTLKMLTEKNYGEQMRAREAQLKALQAQINPHFLYNTLDSINWMALTRGANEISTMITALATYFRLSLNRGKDIVTVEDELNLAKVYLDIQKKRFPQFDYDIRVEKTILPCLLPKLTLQPIIENALLHGIQNKADRQGTIIISGEQTEEGIVVVVEDNGAGMDAEFAETMLARPSKQTSKSYGLHNVLERIQLFAGDTSGIRIHSRPGEGTRVEIRMARNS